MSTAINEMNELDFHQRFRTEEDCYKYLVKLKWADGFVCDRCHHTSCTELYHRKFPLYQCKNCHYQASAIVGTIFERTRTSLLKWFMAIWQMATDKRGFSAKQLERNIGVTYKTAWLMLHKIREAMIEREHMYFLNGIVELDEAFFGAPKKGGKRGRGTDKTMVLAAVSLTDDGKPNFAKMEVIPDAKSTTLVNFAYREIAPGTEIRSDAHRSYPKLSESGYHHVAHVFDQNKRPEHLKWLHVIVGNAKKMVTSTFHGLGTKHLQRYLNEFCYRFNRRRFKGEGFGRLLRLCVNSPTIIRRELENTFIP
ncbi:IS1595 family transposase [Alteribacter aurantiacus]|uniref:IS1595 family transposase n=1 Tax=Alteribacter aurantiacus TaxID=254410 RepID=UPI0006848B72|nr:IS1595 family transposase [Alteribacter aurantiacus]